MELNKFLTFQEGTFQTPKIKKSTLKKFLLFREMELSNPNLKKISYILSYFFKKVNSSYFSYCF